ncbi:S8 family serine peptidase [Promicromonospora sp. NPDC023805]|uniref:S8 family serine peptidase n=1 Tax=Promicromonospora sp. NPDC023805 TaxID=3154696 RepID=UPI0033F205BB
MLPRIRRSSMVLASATALALLAVPGAAVAAPDPHRGSPSGALPGNPAAQAVPGAVAPKDKITPAATRAFQARGTTDFWLRFADDADLTSAKSITSWSERGEYVYDALVATADAAQGQAIAELEKSGAAYTSYWATNAILVEDGSLDQAMDLAADVEVLEVRPTTRYAAPEPVDAAAVPEEDVDAAAVTPAWGITAINANDLWSAGYTGKGMVVANIDTGVDGSHSALAGKYRGQGASDPDAYNYFSVDGRQDPHDTDGHGTHTMGTMVGGTVTHNGVQRAVGVAPGAEWIAAAGGGGGWTDEDLISSGEWILAPFDQGSADPVPNPELRPHVVNNSWGADFSTDPFMEDVITAWEHAGIFSTFANGNSGEFGCDSSGSPGSRTVNYSVGSFTRNGTISEFSSRGPGQSGNVKPDIAAPGSYILSTLPSNQADYYDGTSMAAPHVAGAVALLWDAVPELLGNVPATRAILDGSAQDMNDTSCGGTTDDNNVWGEGKLDVLAAFEQAQAAAFETTTVPTVSGAEYKVGVPLTAAVEAWSPVATFTYQWRRDGRMIPGATKSTYTPLGDDAGAALTVTVLGSADGHLPTAVTSEPTPVVQPTAIQATDPTISGTVRVGSVLRALSGTWTSGTQFKYQWKANGTSISGATAFTYTPKATDRGRQLTVTITGSRPGYITASRTSGAKSVAYGVYSQATPRIDGAPASGYTVTAVVPPATPSASTTTYQWRVNGTSISGATASSYRIPSSWNGHKISVSVTRKGTGFTTKTVTSAQQTVGTKFSSMPTPTVSGSARVGSTVRAVPGTWRPAASVSYQWYSNGVPISGATSSSYTIHGSHYGKKLAVVVTARKTGYATTAKSSGSVATVYRPATTIPADEWWVVGANGIPAATYIAQAGTVNPCLWERYGPSDESWGFDAGYRQRIATVKSGDGSFASLDCGTWVRYYPGMVKPSATTFKDGVYMLGDQLERGTYVTPGPEKGYSCYYSFIKEFTGKEDRSNLVGHGELTGPKTITMPSTAVGFESAGCNWYRVS